MHLLDFFGGPWGRGWGWGGCQAVNCPLFVLFGMGGSLRGLAAD